ncbi:MAG: hypothetical protein ABIK28_06445, partial [Planctomycetota bacterium]
INSNDVELYQNPDWVVASGYFTVRVKMQNILDDTVSLDLSKNEQTCQAKVYLCLGNLEGTPVEQLESWISNGLHGTYCQIPSTGELNLNQLILAAFNSNPNLKKVGIMQVGFDTSSNVVQKVSIMVHKEKYVNWNPEPEVTMEVITSSD